MSGGQSISPNNLNGCVGKISVSHQIQPVSHGSSSSGSNLVVNKPEDVQLTKSQKKRIRKKQATGGKSSAADCNIVKCAPRLDLTVIEIEKVLYDVLSGFRQQINQESTAKVVGSSMPNWECPPYRQRLRGFVNQLSNCYLISCLQALFSIPPFVALLDGISQALHTTFCETGRLGDLWTQALAVNTPVLRQLILLLDEIAPYSPNKTGGSHRYSRFGIIETGTPLKLNPSLTKCLGFEEGHEQDAADCMSRMVTQVHEEMASLLRRLAPEEPFRTTNFNDFDTFEEEEDGWTTIGTHGKKIAEAREAQVDNGETTPVSLLFGGTLVARSSYSKESKKSSKSDIGVKERFFILPLELNSPEIKRMEDCFIHLSKGETLSDFRDPETGSCVVMSRRLFINHLPPVLLLQLNRFYYASGKDAIGNVEFGIHKVLKQIPVYLQLKIPNDVISKEFQYTQVQGTYKLHAIVFHVGYKATRGHYVTSIVGRQTNDSGIIHLDDEKVFHLNPRTSLGNLVDTHKPFDVACGRFQPVRLEKGDGDIPPSISEQPRTPYLLIYTSCFH